MKIQKLPTFDSMAAAAGATGIPLGTLRQAKRSGCVGFEHGRVSLQPVLKWIFSHGADVARLGPFEALAAARAARERHKLRRDEEAFFDKNEVTEYIQKTFMPVREWAMRLPGDLAPRVNPGDPVHAQKILEQWAEDFFQTVQRFHYCQTAQRGQFRTVKAR